jgi:hypothetical protein
VRTTGPSQIVVNEVPHEFDVFRIVRSDDTDDPVFLNSLRSHYELSQEPRRVERNWTVLHMGISAYRTQDQAIDTALAWPRLGGYIAELTLQPGKGINFARSGHSGHLTLWANPVKLLEVVADIEAVG